MSYYNLEFNPFDKDIDVKYSFETNDLKLLNNRLKFIKENKGIGLITGNPGLGKTFTIKKFISELNPNLYKCIYICMSTLTVHEFYRQLCYELDIEPQHKKIDMFKSIQERIISLVKDKKMSVVIILDEAQYLRTEILNDLKLLLNFEYDSKNYVSLILIGLPVLNTLLNRNVFEALKQRITISYNMSGVTKEELIEYIKTRLNIAHGSIDIFNEQAFETIYSACNGSLRIANNIITKSLIIGKNKNSNIINSDIVLEACNEASLG